MTFASELKSMVESQIKRRGIKDNDVIDAMLNVPRHLFLGNDLRDLAYTDKPLPIGENQTVSQPYIVALMTESLELKSNDSVLEIGTGSGYQTAIIARIAGEVYSVERSAILLEKAKHVLSKLEYSNIHFKSGDGTLGWEEFAPYDKIIVTAASPEIPQPLFEQLKPNGRLIIPVGSRESQILKLVIAIENNNFKIEDLCSCIFVPLVGEYGWS